MKLPFFGKTKRQVRRVRVDGNDLHVLEAIRCIQPRVIVVEYNPRFRPPVEWVMAYDPRHVWDETSNFGASLAAWEKTMGKRGYALVGCSFTGVNAFFVREDLTPGAFEPPFRAALHFEPDRSQLIPAFHGRHRPGWSPGA